MKEMGTYVWFFSYLYLAVFAIYSLLYVISRRAIFTTGVIALFLFLLITNYVKPANISGEATIELTCALDQLKTSPDKGFRQTCMFGYPTRQYYLTAIPTLLFGRSLWTLSLGGSLYFILGLFIFCAGCLKFLKQHAYADIVTAGIVSAFFHFHFAMHFLFVFEQGNYPFSLALILAGSFLHFISKPRAIYLVPISLTLVYAIYSYTPSLTLIPLAMLAIIYLALAHKGYSWTIRFSLLSIIPVLLFYLSASLLFRHDINIINTQTRSPELLRQDLIKAGQDFIFNRFSEPFVSPLFIPILGLIVLASASYAFGPIPMVVSAWIVGTIVFSIVSRGYVYYGIDFRLHRASVVLPIFLVQILYLVRSLPKAKIYSYLAVFFVVLTTGITYQLNMLNSRNTHPHWALISSLPQNTTRSNLYLHPDVSEYVSLSDTLRYFRPNISVLPLPDTENCPSEKGGIVLAPKGRACPGNVLGTFTTYSGDELSLSAF